MLRDRVFGTKTSELALGNSYSDAHLRYTYRMDEQENVWEYYFACFARLNQKVGNGESTRNISGISAENELTADDYGRLRTITDDYGRLDEEEKKILHYLSRHESITRRIAIELLNLKKSKVYDILTRLVQRGILIKQGEGRSTHYIVNRNTNKGA